MTYPGLSILSTGSIFLGSATLEISMGSSRMGPPTSRPQKTGWDSRTRMKRRWHRCLCRDETIDKISGFRIKSWCNPMFIHLIYLIYIYIRLYLVSASSSPLRIGLTYFWWAEVPPPYRRSEHRWDTDGMKTSGLLGVVFIAIMTIMLLETRLMMINGD